MARRVFTGLFMLALLILAAAPALAFNTRITVYASVPEMRAVYIDKSGMIYKIAGNTSKNIEPVVYDMNNQPAAMTGTIKAQYQNFMERHNWHLEASKVYKVNELVVNNAPNDQKIHVAAGPSSLALSL